MGETGETFVPKEVAKHKNMNQFMHKNLSDLHSKGADFRKKVYILTLCVYIHPEMSRKNRSF